ncbi:MAG: trypsin-like peptidase domain-containing protein [Isosphaeraceae bacterium]|nr:trypsin-like peptidase domain-containing protein [Isosphaeraceae bacterium]
MCWLAAGVTPAAEPRSAGRAGAQGRPSARDDLTGRPTVIVRKGLAQGSGTIVWSAKGESLVLTAAHVVKEAGPLAVELHRYNVGREREANHGEWPRRCPGAVAAADAAADLAIVRLGGLPALPYVARLAPGDEEPERGAVLTSVGIDHGSRLTSWNTRLTAVIWLKLEGERAERPFLVTEQFPEQGRSGGGLYAVDGGLIGVCVGRVGGGKEKKTVGLFASSASIRRLLRDHDLDGTLLRTPADRPVRGKARAQPSP